MSPVSPVPPPANIPTPPEFGWVVNPKWLTPGELEDVEREAGGPMQDKPLLFCALIAIAYARRVDVQAYPWACARRIPIVDINAARKRDEERDAAERDMAAEALAHATMAAVEEGKDAPDPA